jgi:hypothetical protein
MIMSDLRLVKPHLCYMRVSKIWLLTYENKTLFGPDWMDLIDIFYEANPVRIAKYA